jgi:hypothetical protein
LAFGGVDVEGFNQLVDLLVVHGVYEESLNSIKNITGGIVILEHVTDVDFTGYKLIKQKKYGKKFVSFLILE